MTTPPDLPVELRETLDAWLDRPWSAQRLSGDVSARVYFRVISSGESYIAAWYPESMDGAAVKFVTAHRALAGHLPLPAVVRATSRVVVQRDASDATLYDLLHRAREAGVEAYKEATGLLASLQGAPPHAWTLNPPFDATAFTRELEMTSRWWIEEICGADATPFRALASELASAVARHPYTLCHRDYHGQNIHIDKDELIVIDYQDVRPGPDTYDLASLLRDRGVAEILDDEVEETLIEHYRTLTGRDESLRHRYFEMLLQRTIKIIGTFARASAERGKRQYLDFIPPAIRSLERCLAELPEYRSIGRVFPTSRA